jgi:hypothetical protein
MDAQEIFDMYEQDYDFEKLKEAVFGASEETTWGLHGIFSCLTEDDNALPQLLRVDYKRRAELLTLLIQKKIKKEDE